MFMSLTAHQSADTLDITTDLQKSCHRRWEIKVEVRQGCSKHNQITKTEGLQLLLHQTSLTQSDKLAQTHVNN